MKHIVVKTTNLFNKRYVYSKIDTGNISKDFIWGFYSGIWKNCYYNIMPTF